MRLINTIKELSFFDTFKHVSTYFSGTVLVHALGLITLPIFTAFLTTEEYGIINVFTSITMLCVVMLSCNVISSVQRYYFEENNDISSFVSTILGFTQLTFLLGATIIYIYRVSFADWINLPVDTIPWMLLTIYATIFLTIYNQIKIAQKASVHFVRMQVAWQYGKFGLAITAILLVASSHLDQSMYMAKIGADAIITIIASLFALYLIKSFLCVPKDILKHLKYAFVYAIPLLPFVLSSYILTAFDQWYINTSIGNAEAGLYSFAYKIGFIYMGFSTALLNGAAPSYYEMMNQGELSKVTDQLKSMVRLLSLAGCFLILFSMDLGRILSSSEQFETAFDIIPVLVLAYLFYGVATFYNRAIYYNKQNIYLTVIIVFVSVVNIVLNIKYIPIYGYKAAAYTTLISYFLMAILSVIVVKTRIKMGNQPVLFAIRYISVLVGLILIDYYFVRTIGLTSIFQGIIKIILFLVFGVVLFRNKISIILNIRHDKS